MIKKIIIDGSSLTQNRGVGSYVNSLISGLSKIKISSNISFILILPNYCNISFTSRKNIKVLKRPFINKILWNLLLLPLYSWWENGDLLHNTENTGGSFFSRLLGIKVLLTLHDVSFLKPFHLVGKPKTFQQWIGLFYRRLFIKSITSYSKIVITVSKFAKKDIVSELGISNKKIKVIYNSLSSNFFLPRTCAQEKKILLVTGNSNQKNFDRTLKFLNLNKDILNGWKIFVVGINGNNSKHIKFFGNMNKKRLIRYYDKSSILIMPSLYESFSIPIIEGLARGLYVISSNKGGPNEVLRKHGSLYNPYSNIELRKSLIKAIDYLRKKKTKDSNKKAINYARSFTEQKLAKKTLNVYKKLLK